MKWYNSGTAGWKRCTGQSMRKGCRAPSPNLQKLSHPFPRGFLWNLHYTAMIDSIAGPCWPNSISSCSPLPGVRGGGEGGWLKVPYSLITWPVAQETNRPPTSILRCVPKLHWRNKKTLCSHHSGNSKGFRISRPETEKGQLDIYYKSQYHPSSVGPSLTTLFKITDLYRGLPNTSPSFFTLLYLEPFDVLYNYYFIDI